MMESGSLLKTSMSCFRSACFCPGIASLLRLELSRAGVCRQTAFLAKPCVYLLELSSFESDLETRVSCWCSCRVDSRRVVILGCAGIVSMFRRGRRGATSRRIGLAVLRRAGSRSCTVLLGILGGDASYPAESFMV